MDFLSPCGSTCTQLSEKITLIAIFLYLYNYIGNQIFSKAFFRQLVYVFQTIRIFIVLAGILTPVLHKQINQFVKPGAPFGYPAWVIGALALNLVLAYVLVQVGHRLDRSLELSSHINWMTEETVRKRRNY